MWIRGDEDEGRIFFEAENEDGDEKYFRWWGNE
jgi:hypothetical protein